MLKYVYGDDTVTLKTVYTWFKKFSYGSENVDDDHRSGRSITSRTGTNIDRVRELTVTLVKQLLAQHRVIELWHQLYSRDLSSRDFFLFPKLKVGLKGRRFADITHI
ncbi:hypothetical protein AVEN_272799-1 [Araneus ventricosus]|uniref:Mos1 transposase HTH domain-containing protein n=1 Tax=Araneus ventricosus TaxID=182803 RepID=A0A4Y2H9X4_ARAVE|nr:hypothetical protein AVEN_272799-1 [Araneus ventricosus]